MAEKDEEFLARLLATFRVEAQEHLHVMFSGLAELERMPDEARQTELIEAIFREAHSLKGASGSVGLSQVGQACQSIETTFAAMKRKEITFTPELFDNLHRALDRVSALLGNHRPSEEKKPAAAAPTPAPLAPPAVAAQVKQHKEHKEPLHHPTERKFASDTVRIATEKLDCMFMQAEEMLAAKLFTQHRKEELRRMHAAAVAHAKQWRNIKTLHPDLYKALSEHPHWLEQFERNAEFIKAMAQELGAISKAADQDQRMLGRMVDELLESMKEARMQPFSMLTETFPKLVRDLAREQGKEINFTIQGGSIEIDRRVLEEIKDALIHIVRNCVDHGIEQPAERARKQKPARGEISINITPQAGDKVEIRISDDGGGVDTDKVKQAAERLGFLHRDDIAQMEAQDAVQFIFQSGVSTSPIITEVSGRGLGLAIVREKVEKLGGSISIQTQPGSGTSFCLSLPNTLATYRGIVVRVGEQSFVLPTRGVLQSQRVLKESMQTVENRESIRVGNETLALAWLGDVLGVNHVDNDDTRYLHILVLSNNGQRIAFAVDDILGEQEVLVKSLGKQLARVRNIEAATILGSGKVVPILHVADLMRSALHAPARGAAQAAQEQAVQQKSVLVVEDSITARTLLKGVLEMAGYKVSTAVDGLDGLMQLRSKVFDIVVSDVEMPRMNGFDLTAKIRSDKKLEDIPVVLVTALESRADRERGIEVGANAYIVKRSFEESNLLEVIERLI